MRGPSDTRRQVVTLLTDFGTRDTFVGAMKGVILGIAPDAQLVDLTHEIPPQSIRSAAFQLVTVLPYFPEGTVHLVVVDPGVGSERRPVAVQCRHACFVAPDNGVLTLALRSDRPQAMVRIENIHYRLPRVSSTFHGRDVFAPAAAHLARGVPVTDLGPPIEALTRLDLPRAVVDADGTMHGHVQHIDRFGNLVTDIRAEILSASPQATFAVAGRTVKDLSLSYSAAPPDTLLAYVGSTGFVEIAVHNGSAAERLGAAIGTPVTCQTGRRDAVPP